MIIRFRDCDEPLRLPDCVAVQAGDLYLIVNTDTREIETRIAVDTVAHIDCNGGISYEAKLGEVVSLADYR